MLGGGGYTMRNVSRAWAYETGLAAGVELGAGAVSPNYDAISTLTEDKQTSRSMSTTSTSDPTTSSTCGRLIWRT